MTRTFDEMSDLWNRLPDHFKRTTDAHYVSVFREEKKVWERLSLVTEAEWSILKAVASATDSHKKQAMKRKMQRLDK